MNYNDFYIIILVLDFWIMPSIFRYLLFIWFSSYLLHYQYFIDLLVIIVHEYYTRSWEVQEEYIKKLLQVESR